MSRLPAMRPGCYYSANTYYVHGLMPPYAAPDSIWKEWTRLREEFGEVYIPELYASEVQEATR